ncbi:DUF3298 and DUF4163 domain-containing protein [Mariniflexile gromovii]|uniref:DUF3298 and DUF4163 domain-containing protein n=1 Tax=Mariniflexile gromovii TaxID=362523 RepID=A0ABS4BYC3_9FLAO|nr:DUF3298 and DUF4163 domain-containing protein [Mariniflexile gromovii]MBP0905583.1 DUF3298 and DUF4163 domain-containing protein [Mariniflexile gromovii]
MHYKKFLLSISFLCFLFSCNKELKTTFLDTNITTANNKLVEINVPKAAGNEQIASQINSEINKTIIAVLQIGDQDAIVFQTVEESITAFNNEYNAFNKDFPDVSQPWEAQVDGELMHQSPEVISIAITSYVNTGGAHGITHISFLNFDATTGKRIENSHLIKNKDAFKSVAQSYFKDAITEEDILFEPDTFQLPANIGFNEEGIILLYNTYEIAPYSTGIIEFTIPIEKVSDYLTFNGS